MVSFSMCLIGVYMNLQLTFLLKNEDYFGKMDSDDITKISSLLTVVSLPCSMIATFFVSHAWELLGRKFTIFISFFLTSFVYVLFPYTGSKSNNFSFLFIVRCIVAIVMAAPISHPLINDYVCRSYRGKAIALNGIGYILGELGAMGLNFATINQKPEI